ncbi:MAG: ATP synthase F1 subunit delta [Alphaproteobacteria bacterium]|nr:ATP synthase F1 subunit delta [Alphaproteobacteria bacterium]
MTDWSFIKNDSVVSRYIKSLYEVAVSLGKEKEIAEQLAGIKRTISHIENFEKFIKKATLMHSFGMTFINDLVRTLKLCKEVENFLKLLLKNKRFTLLTDICSGYEKFVSEVNGEKVFHVTYAKSFTKSDEERLLRNLKWTFGENVKCVAKKDESLIDGMTVQYRSKILDYSVKSRLERLHSAIRGDNYEN